MLLHLAWALYGAAGKITAKGKKYTDPLAKRHMMDEGLLHPGMAVARCQLDCVRKYLDTWKSLTWGCVCDRFPQAVPR